MDYTDNLSMLKRSKSGDEKATEELIIKNYPLALSIAKRYKGRGVETEDLIQLALIGMLKAIRSFDLSKGCAFSTYAVPLIMGEIRKFMRDDGLIKVSREARKNSAVIIKFKNEYTEKYGYEPHIEEISQGTGLDSETVTEALNASLPVSSLFEGKSEETAFTLEGAVEDKSASMDLQFEKIALWEAIKRLPAEDRKLIILRYFRDMSQQKTAEALGISQVKVSRREKKIIEKLRLGMRGEG